MVTKENWLQTTCLNMLHTFETQKINAGGSSMDTTKRLQDNYLDVAAGFGVRNENLAIKKYMDPESSDRKL
jgi:hypothetical protein